MELERSLPKMKAEQVPDQWAKREKIGELLARYLRHLRPRNG